MAGPTILDLSVITEIKNDDILYGIRGVAAGRDKQFEARFLGKYDLVIQSQAEFEKYFGTGDDEATGVTGTTEGGWVCVDLADNETVTIPANTSILLKSNPAGGITAHFKYDATNYNRKAYELNTRINLSTGVTIHGEGIDQTIIARKSDDNYPMFITTYLEREAVPGVATNIFTVASSEHFQPGQTIEHSNDNEFYKVINVPDGTHVTTDKIITGAAAGNINVCQDNIELKDFTFDGRCDIDNLGGTRTNRAFDLNYCAHSNFEAKVINCKEQLGGAYKGDHLVYKLKIQNIFHCQSTNVGGAVYRCSNSEIKNIHNCNAYSTTGGTSGGAVYDCNKSKISDIYDCYSETTNAGNNSAGGACSLCDDSEINNVWNCRCTVTTGNAEGGGCYQCDNTPITNIHNCDCFATGAAGDAFGGGCAECDESKISNIYNCSCIVTTGNADGGGCYQCDTGKISNIYDCNCHCSGAGTANGAGAHSCDNGTIMDFHNNTANDAVGNNGEGGAAAHCDNVTILGNFTGNLNDGGAGANDTFHAMTNYCNNFTFDGAADQTAAAGPTDWN